MLNIAIFISGRGSNMEALLKAISDGRLSGITPKIVISDKKDAEGLSIAESFGVKTKFIDCTPYKTKLVGQAEKEVISLLKENNIDLLCLAGFLRMIKENLLKEYKNRIINIHPSLLPKYPGLCAQAQALEDKASVSGCTVHFVDEGMDTGNIIRQTEVEVRKTDTVQTLSSRILKAEHETYWRVLSDIALGKIKIGQSK